MTPMAEVSITAKHAHSLLIRSVSQKANRNVPIGSSDSQVLSGLIVGVNVDGVVSHRIHLIAWQI